MRKGTKARIERQKRALERLHIRIIVQWGRDGEQYAATRIARGGAIHMRRWMTPTRRWAKWRKLFGNDVLRLATPDDISTFNPDYGPAWERD